MYLEIRVRDEEELLPFSEEPPSLIESGSGCRVHALAGLVYLDHSLVWAGCCVIDRCLRGGDGCQVSRSQTGETILSVVVNWIIFRTPLRTSK